MTHFTQRLSRAASAGFAPRSGAMRDVLWGRPVFRAPQLNPRVPFEPLPFTANRITRRVADAADSAASLINVPAPAN
ncbi:MAG: hypothetical protein KF715_07475 [Candidatus Didemnitutus sp.]|nr:hypothetical protein [Candidatus Didemnitutus sp.]